MLYVVEIVMVFHYCPPASSLRRKSYFWLPDRAPRPGFVQETETPLDGSAPAMIHRVLRRSSRLFVRVKTVVKGGLWGFWCWCWGMMVLCGVDDEGLFMLRA